MWGEPLKRDKILNLRILLDKAHLDFIRSNEVQHDALAPALVYKNNQDKELAAFICSILAYGRIAQVKKSIQRVLDPMGKKPSNWLINASDRDILNAVRGWTHRFNTASDMFLMLKILRYIYRSYGSIEKFLKPSHETTARELIENLYAKFHWVLNDEIGFVQELDGFAFFLPDPKKGGACKRINLFLKWMVRDQTPDLGLWKKFHKKNLIIPLDTHIYRQAKALKLTKRSIADWKTAEEITTALAKIDPTDPTKYDFALCHLGIRGKIIQVASLGKS